MKQQTFAASVLLLFSLFFAFRVFAQDSTSINATVKVSICGNSVIEGGEDCEGTDLNGKTCADLSGFSGGTLLCDISCGFDTSGCIAATPTPTVMPTSIPAGSLTASALSPTNTPVPTKAQTPATKVAKNLPALVQLFGSPESGTIPSGQLHAVMSVWVNTWKQSNSPSLSATTKTTATATCDVNHDNVCDIRDLSVLLFYVQ